MMKTEDAVQTIQAILQQSPTWHVWVVSYMITQGLLSVLLHQGNYPHEYIEILCGGCSYFSGEMQGGPYSLQITKEHYQGEESLSLRGNQQQLVILFDRISLGQRKGK